mgnify:CR=1 FL=1
MLSLTPEQIAEIQAQLAEAKAARHILLTQGGVVKTMTRARDSIQETQWSPAKLSDLERYIAELERQLGLCPSIVRARSRRGMF